MLNPWYHWTHQHIKFFRISRASDDDSDDKHFGDDIDEIREWMAIQSQWRISNVDASSSRAATLKGIAAGRWRLTSYDIDGIEHVTDSCELWRFVYRDTAFECLN